MAAAAPSCSKPSEIAPLDAYVLAEVINDVGLLRPCSSLVTASARSSGEAIAAHPDIDMVSFTGRPARQARRRGRESDAQSASRSIGGKSGQHPPDDLDDAGFEKWVRDGIGKAYLNQGQTCTALTRMLVPNSRMPTPSASPPTKWPRSSATGSVRRLRHDGPAVVACAVERVTNYIQKGIDRAPTSSSAALEPGRECRRVLRAAHGLQPGAPTT